MQKVRTVLIVVLTLCLLFSMTSGGFLVVNNPQHADVIVVLAGETFRRPNRGLELLSQNYAPKMLLDVPAVEMIYGQNAVDMAQNYLQELPQSQALAVCPIYGLSTKTEAEDVMRCLQPLGAGSVLVVTSDYHTRRALSTFQHELPGYRVYVAAARDPGQFNVKWWNRRQWAKLNFDEWIRLVWWECVDRWR